MSQQEQERDPIKYEKVTDKVNFGKYRDEELIVAYEQDPMYFRWAAREGAIDRDSFKELIPFETDELIDYDGKVNIVYETSFMRFGKHRGTMIKDIMSDDPEYMEWLTSEGVIQATEFPGV